jgi:hypothetical protein
MLCAAGVILFATVRKRDAEAIDAGHVDITPA